MVCIHLATSSFLVAVISQEFSPAFYQRARREEALCLGVSTNKRVHAGVLRVLETQNTNVALVYARTIHSLRELVNIGHVSSGDCSSASNHRNGWLSCGGATNASSKRASA